MADAVPLLYLVIEAGPTAHDRLAAVLGQVAAASVLITPVAGASLDPGRAKSLVEISQARGAAALILADAKLARTLEADGVHLGPSPALAADHSVAREILGSRGIIGIDPGASRHDAMVAAEAAADYVGFSLAGAGGERDDLVEWWAAIFEVPVVAFDIATADEARLLTRHGADFLGIQVAAATPLADEIKRLSLTAEAASEAAST